MTGDPDSAGHAPSGDNATTWQPYGDYLDRSRLRSFCDITGNASLSELRDWGRKNIGLYWDAAVKHLELEWQKPYSSIISLEDGKPWPRWFIGGHFNYVSNALDRWATPDHANRIALRWEGDSGESRQVRFDELLPEVNRFANALLALGVHKGDRIGIFMPMLPETVIATLACGKIGAIYIPLFSGFGEQAVASRLEDCDATVLITTDAFPRRGKTIPIKRIADEAMAQVTSLHTCIVLQRSGVEVDMTAGRDHWWHDVVSNQSADAETIDTAASDPYMIIYTSGTTGKPKGTVHVHAGFPVKAAHDLAYCFDLRSDDTIFWLTDLGWMMGPWLIAGGLIHGATLMLFEGTPEYPSPDRLWSIIEEHGVSVLGVAPTVIRALKAHGTKPVSDHDLSTLRVLGSTGETWDPDSWEWFFRVVGNRDLPIINYSGGTETGGGILGNFVSEPIRSCAFTAPIPGMDADVVDEYGDPVQGTVGELVIRQPWVGMTGGFWRDRERYLDTYWSRFPDTWVHGDWTEVDDDGFWYIRGRSDDVLKISGKRIGPAELESAASTHPAVQEAAAIGVPHPVKGETAHIFAVLVNGHQPGPDLEHDIRQTVRHHLGASMQPDGVHFIPELPKTRNGKIMRRVIRAAFLGLPMGDNSALENASIIDHIANLQTDRARHDTGEPK